MVRKESRLQSLPRTRSGGKPLPRCIEPGFVPSEEVDPEGMRKLMAKIMATAVAGYRQARDPRKRSSILAWLEDREKSPYLRLRLNLRLFEPGSGLGREEAPAGKEKSKSENTEGQATRSPLL